MNILPNDFHQSNVLSCFNSCTQCATCGVVVAPNTLAANHIQYSGDCSQCMDWDSVVIPVSFEDIPFE